MPSFLKTGPDLTAHLTLALIYFTRSLKSGLPSPVSMQPNLLVFGKNNFIILLLLALVKVKLKEKRAHVNYVRLGLRIFRFFSSKFTANNKTVIDDRKKNLLNTHIYLHNCKELCGI